MYYFAEKINRSTPFDYYEKMFWFTFPQAYTEDLSKLNPTQSFDTTGVVNWLTIEEAFAKQLELPKKIFIDIYANGVVSNTIMNRTNYRSPAIAKKLNENYYPVRFDAMSKDTVLLGNSKFINNPQHPFHDIAVQFAILNNKMMLPTVVFIDEKGQAITRLQEYLNPVSMESFLQFVADDKYKTMQWQAFNTSYKAELKY